MSNLISSVVVVPVQTLRLAGLGKFISSSEHLEFWLCQAARTLLAIAVEAAIFSVLLIAVDRYCAVTSPLHYSMTITRGRSVRLIVGVWLIAMLYALPQLLAPSPKHKDYRPPMCPHGDVPWAAVPQWFGLVYAVLLFVLGFAIPLCALVWIYVRMYRAAKSNINKTRRHSLGTNPHEIIIPDCPSTPDSGNHNSVRGNRAKLARRRSSNTSLFFREEGRAVKTSVIVITSYIATWLPYFVVKICEAAGWTLNVPFLEEIVNSIAMSSSCTLPFIYVYRNETASNEALKIICWWRPPVPATPSFSRSSLHARLSNGHVPSPVRIVEPDTASLCSYSVECRECGQSQLVCSLRSGVKSINPTTVSSERRSGSRSPKRESSVSFKLAPTPMERPFSRCRQCLRQDSASSASSDDPLLSECYRYPRVPSNTSVRWTRPRMSNGSVTTRSDSLASTSSSVVSGVHRWPMRRYSTISTDSGGGTTVTQRRSIHEDMEDGSRLHPILSRQGGQLLEGDEDNQALSTIHPEIHGYSNPFRHPRLCRQQESTGSSVRFIWEIEEGDRDEDSTESESQRHLQLPTPS
ncbi:unnamed protein product [Meganyctiphanes norvegica]|uniref:G-protein coupled receptors family 1 profile domain-containing protein n=1 Tax=Meganyctiphanes norvegica TaxID=48144 RepID=A0AAV2QKR7_MEGNR